MDKYTIREEHAERFSDWLKNRGGLAIWRSVDLSDPGLTLTTPALTDGKPTPKPHWKVANAPERIITDPNDVIVSKDVEVKRFRVGVRPGAQGLVYKVTDGGTRRIRAAVAKAGDGAFYEFDYTTQEAVILKPSTLTPLVDYR